MTTFLQGHREREAMDKKINDFHKMLGDLGKQEAEIKEVDDELHRATSAIEKIKEKLATTRQKIEGLVDDPDMALKQLVTLEEEMHALQTSVSRHERVARLLHLRRQELAINFVQARRRAKSTRIGIIAPHADRLVKQELEGLSGLIDALTLKGQTSHEAARQGINVDAYLANIVYEEVRRRLAANKPSYQSDPLLSRLQSVPNSALPDLPDVSSPVRLKKLRASIEGERQAIIGRAADGG